MMNLLSYRRLLCLALAALPTLAACAQKQAPAKLDEAPDFWNLVDRFGIKKMYRYSDLVANSDIKTPTIPWSDTYWPLASQSLAWRYAEPQPASVKEEVGVAAFLHHFADEAAKATPDPKLSPAEKYDLVYAQRHSLALASPDVAKIADSLADLDKKIQAQADVPSKKALLAQMRSTLLAANFATSASMTVSGWTTFLRESDASGNRYLSLDSATGADWSWEGHCHGWSPAAVMSLPPKHGVMASINDKKVFFSEGDVRGLMTKAWADSAPADKQYFLAKRCEQSPDDPHAPIAAAADGKGYAGTVHIDGKDRPFVVTKNLPKALSVTVGGAATLLNLYQIRIDYVNMGPDILLLEDPKSGQFWLADSIGAVVDAMNNNSIGDAVRSVQANLTGCWDPNPASFHEVLVAQLAERKLGFVMDRTRTGQVWNQPIYAASFDIGPLQSVANISDVSAQYRADGTAFVAEVTATVQWSGEPGSPQLAYDQDFDAGQLEASTYQYTLEFDRDSRLIGGEWGTLQKMDPTAESPDFLFGFQAGAVPDDALNLSPGNSRIDYSGIIAKLHDCSLSAATDGKLTLSGQDLPYTTCAISKAP